MDEQATFMARAIELSRRALSEPGAPTRMYDTAELVLIAATFLLAGAVKGVVGLGLPATTVSILTATLGLTNGLALIVVPTCVTNAWQAAYSPNLRAIY